MTERSISKPKSRRKVCVFLPPDVQEMLDAIVGEKQLKPREVISDAIKVLTFVMSEKADGRRIYSIGPDGGDGLELVIL